MFKITFKTLGLEAAIEGPARVLIAMLLAQPISVSAIEYKGADGATAKASDLTISCFELLIEAADRDQAKLCLATLV